MTTSAVEQARSQDHPTHEHAVLPRRLPKTGNLPDLPPGQSAIAEFPRYGTHFMGDGGSRPVATSIRIGGEVETPFAVDMTELANLPRTEITADFHCVAG